MSADNFGGVRKVRRRRRGSDSVAETLAEWKMANNQVDSAKDGLNQNQRVPSKGSKKGCMRGKGGPENSVCDYRGVRQRTWGRWVAEIREPINRSHKPSKGKRLWLGTFDSAVDAALAYDEASKTMYGPYARLNFPEHGTETEQLPITPSSISTTPTRTPDSATISSNFEVSPTGELKTNNSADIVREIKDVKCTPINHGNSLNDGDEDEELVILKEEMKEESTDITNFSDCDRFFKEESDYFHNLLDEKMFEIGPLREDGFHGQLDSSALRQEQSHDFGQLDNFALRQEGNCDSGQFGLSNNGTPSDLSYQLQNQDTELPWSSSHMEEEVDYSLNSSRPDSALDEQGDLWFPGSGFY